MKTFEISDKCNACGLCTQQTDLLVEDKVGKAVPAKKCVITSKNLAEAESVVKMCPVNAIKIVEKGEIKSLDKNSLLNLLKTKLEKVEKPTIKKDDIKLDAFKYQITWPGFEGQNKYKYSSESSAMSAAISEFNRVAYSQYRKIITEILVQYREDKLKKYYTFDKNSFWGQANAKYENVLLDFANEVEAMSDGKIKLPADFAKFEAYPGGIPDVEKSNHMWILKHFDEYQIIDRVMADFNSSSYHTKNAYEMYINIDDMEVYAGRGFFGGDNYKTKYAYGFLFDVIQEYFKDLRGSINYVDIDDRPLSEIESAIKSYNEEVKKLIDEKIKIVEYILNNPEKFKEYEANKVDVKNFIDRGMTAEEYVLKRFVPDKITKSTNV